VEPRGASLNFAFSLVADLCNVVGVVVLIDWTGMGRSPPAYVQATNYRPSWGYATLRLSHLGAVMVQSCAAALAEIKAQPQSRHSSHECGQ
jgi:hypothetical protein